MVETTNVPLYHISRRIATKLCSFVDERLVVVDWWRVVKLLSKIFVRLFQCHFWLSQFPQRFVHLDQPFLGDSVWSVEGIDDGALEVNGATVERRCSGEVSLRSRKDFNHSIGCAEHKVVSGDQRLIACLSKDLAIEV